MEEPESEWDIQDYSSSKEGDEMGMVKWMLKKGCGIGKKMVISGIAISSAPLVLPPLVVFSAMGVAFSVPFGLVFASYTCTNKLMSMLLPPTPPSPIMLEYYSYEYEQEKEDGVGVACRFELDGGGDDYRQIGVAEKGNYTCNEYDDDHIGRDNVMQEVEQDQNGDGYAQEVEALVTNADGDVVEKGYYTNEYDDDEIERENLTHEEEEIGRENLMQEKKVQIGEGYVQEVEPLVINADGDVVRKGYFTNEYYGDEVRRENVMQEVEQEQIVDGYVQEVEALVINADGDVVEKGYYTSEYVDGETRRENVMQEVEQEQIGEGYVQEVEALVTNVDGDAVKVSSTNDYGDDEIRRENLMQEEEKEQIVEGYVQKVETLVANVDGDAVEVYYTNEYNDDEIRRQNLMQEEEKEQISERYVQEVEALVTNLDVNVVKRGYYTNEYNDDEIGRENVMPEEEKEQIGEGYVQEVEALEGYVQEVEALVTNTDGDVVEKGYYTDEKEREGEEDDLRLENVVDDERMEDTIQGVDIVFETDDDGDDDTQQGEALAVNVDENVDGESYNINENYNGRKMEDHVPRLGNVIKNEEREKLEDIKQAVETRLALAVTTDESKQTEEGSITNIAEGVDNQGYEEDVGEYLEGDDDSLEEEQKGNELVVESRMNENISKTPEVTDDEKKKEGSDEARVHNNICEDDSFVEGSASNAVSEEVKDIKTAEPVLVKEIESPKLVEDESKNNEPVGEMRHIVALAGGNEDDNFNSREVEEIDLVAREVGHANKDERTIESDEKVMRESMGTQETIIGEISNGGAKVAILGTKEEHLIRPNADAREIGDESGLDLFDDRNTSTYFESLEAGDEAKINASSENVDFMALPAFSRVSLDTLNAKLSPTTYTKMPLREDIIDEENIWAKIGAMRAIVGYKVPSQPTCIEELKALFVFTGVEPPASFKGDSDLDEVNVKLKFLMSIVGVK